jgi:hypothetical protein
MNCHTLVNADSEKLLAVRSSFQTGQPIEWVRVHDMPDYAYFDHSIHIRAGVSCISCHGNVAEMEVVSQVTPLSMGWCLECHRNPEPHLRPVNEVTNMKWTPPSNQEEMAARIIEEKQLAPPQDCSSCHR